MKYFNWLKYLLIILVNRMDNMNGVAALFVGAIVAYIVKGFLGDSTFATVISIIVGFVVMGFVASL